MAYLSVKLNVPKAVIEKYEEHNGDLGKALSERIIQCADYTSEKPLYIDDRLRRRLDRLFGKNFNKAEEVVHMMERYVTVRVGEIDLQLSPQLLARLRSRCFGKPFDQFLKDQIIEGLEEYTRMR